MTDPNQASHKAEGEAVCFTAGPKGAFFGAGVIHAWLASARDHPSVAAGISAGAFSAAAMQRCYQELKSAKEKHAGATAHERQAQLEAARWAWYRRYLSFLTDDPLDFLWRAIPDPIDFSADQPPVIDLSRPKAFLQKEAAARRHYYILTRLGVWISGVPVRVSTFARFFVHHVRSKERYGFRVWNWLTRFWAGFQIGTGIFWHILTSPSFFSERPYWDRFAVHEEGSWKRLKRGSGAVPVTSLFPRPLLGWPAWLASVAIAGCVAFASFSGLVRVLVWRIPIVHGFYMDGPICVRLLAIAVSVSIALAVNLIYTLPFEGARNRLVLAISRHVFSQLDISKGLLHNYQLRKRLLELFGTPEAEAGSEKDVKLSDQPFAILLVSACLQDTEQYHAKKGDSLVDGLAASLAIPGVFAPVSASKSEPLDLIDGAAIRQNPLPALFSWLSSEDEIASALERECDEASIHVVYSVPIHDYETRDSSNKPPDIVEAAFVSSELARRRDTRQEVRQTNFTANLQRLLRAAGVNPESEGTLRISADEIAPGRDIKFKNDWDPTPREVLRTIASGCKVAMERHYVDQIGEIGNRKPIKCADLLCHLTASRAERLPFIRPAAPGLPEICRECTRTLKYAPPPLEEAPAGVVRNYGQNCREDEVDWSRFEHLKDEGGRGRIVFVASGGVFRGAFHIGTLAAMQLCHLKPDLIVGASVGALMGAALGAMFVIDAKNSKNLLHELTWIFLNVDSKVALTRTFKNTAKQLGIRLRDVRLSPAEIRKMVRQGSQSDAGYAAAGAPPALVDAISRVFLIPFNQTVSIACDFLAGHFTDAVNRFLTQVRQETLPSLDVKHALMGISLLEGVARRLMSGGDAGIPMNVVQPYHRGNEKISFFATTSNINRRMALLLGRDYLTSSGSYDFVYAGLSSSAFPVVFAPRKESELLPGRGRSDVFFADGGMFDNLPFLPAVEILQAAQTSGRSGRPDEGIEDDSQLHRQILDQLEKRVSKPDIFIAAALDPDPDQAPIEFDSFLKIRERAGTLAANGKIEAFAKTARRTHDCLRDLAAEGTKRELRKKLESAINHSDPQIRSQRLKLLDGVVDASILKIVPADSDHLNGTFAFCRSAGMAEERIKRSIADGCYQTLREIAKRIDQFEFATLSEMTRGLRFSPDRSSPQHSCPWFVLNHTRLECPFAVSEDETLQEGQSNTGDSVAPPGDGTSAEVEFKTPDGRRRISEIRKLCGRDPVHRLSCSGTWSGTVDIEKKIRVSVQLRLKQVGNQVLGSLRELEGAESASKQVRRGRIRDTNLTFLADVSSLPNCSFGGYIDKNIFKGWVRTQNGDKGSIHVKMEN